MKEIVTIGKYEIPKTAILWGGGIVLALFAPTVIASSFRNHFWKTSFSSVAISGIVYVNFRNKDEEIGELNIRIDEVLKKATK